MEKINPESYKIVERAKNFHGNINPLAIQNEFFYIELQGLCEMIEVDLEKMRGLSKEKMLKMIFSRIYNFVISFNDDYSIFDNNMLIYDDVFNACFFTALCMFLYNTKRIKGLSLRRFIYIHSPLKYNIPNTENYFDYDNKQREFDNSKDIISEDTKLRKYRHRFLSERPVYSDSPEWSAMRKASEHEWALYYNLNMAENEVIDTFKRIKNLYRDIYAALHSPMDTNYIDRLETAYDKFSSKLEKIKYENVLKLHKFILEHIHKDKNYYGINLYRFEKELRLYSLTNEINKLLECKDEDEESNVLDKSMIMNEIIFPKLYEYFGNLENLQHVDFYTRTFNMFQGELVASSCLVIDKFVEDGVWEEDWENLFLKTINAMTEIVLYDPEKINYSVTPKSQEMFINDIDVPVCKDILYHVKLSQLMQIPISESEDEI